MQTGEFWKKNGIRLRRDLVPKDIYATVFEAERAIDHE